MSRNAIRRIAARTVSVTTAIATARTEADLHREGGQWVCNVYDAARRLWQQGATTTYARARRDYHDTVVARAVELVALSVGVGEEEANRLGNVAGFSDPQRYVQSVAYEVRAAVAVLLADNTKPAAAAGR